ncbi:C-type lectin domain-containing protein [Caenorhabditis elegans]|uniref:C-type lectin domain-containing protein n=1 Tax=Caenorhabditis elegans TaxID=6239 RepID=G5ECS2_CAEEL|nr:C-type lectin domain-containing protein [Caenorhabditis elegans]CAB07683.2 C-type lectin domain-containing protein [Caenorhabditis elegans]|eukprot:NP_492973.2 Uncharacterized protein CELE_W04G5.7 [Caenorhabditis elegans]
MADVLPEIIGIIDDGLTIGSFSYPKIAEKLLKIAAWGSFVKDMIGILNPDKPDPVMLKLIEIDKKLTQLSDKMSWEFDNLKAFIVENEFYADLAQTASTLMKFMQDTVKYPCKDSYGIFRDVSQKSPPLQYAYKMISLLEQESTNPLKMAMKADPLRTSETFDKWRGIIEAVMAQFLFLETYINGLFWNKNMYGPNRLKDRITHLNHLMDSWRREYEDSYWDTVVERMVHDIQDRYENSSNGEKSKMICDHLFAGLNRNCYYVIVYDPCAGYDHHAFYGRDYIVSFRRGGCNVGVFQSKTYDCVSQAVRNKFQHDALARVNEVNWNWSYADVTKWLWQNITNCDLTVVIALYEHIWISYVYYPSVPSEPGWSCNICFDDGEKYFFFAGFNLD